MDGNDPAKRKKTAAGARGPLRHLHRRLSYIWHLIVLPGYWSDAQHMSCPPSAYTRAIPSSMAVSATALATTSATLLFNGDAMMFSAFSSLSGIMLAMA